MIPTPNSKRTSPGRETSQSLPAAAMWSLGAKFADQLVGVVSISILARLLSPNDFGVVAMAAALVALIEIFTSFGFDWALVRVQSPDRQHYDTAWSLRLMLAATTCLVLGVSSIPLSVAMHAPHIAPLIVAMGLNGLLGSLENIGVVDFRRNMRFDLEFRYRLAGRIAGILVAVGLAFMTRSYWSLVLGVTANRAGGIVASYVMHPFRPRWCVSKRAELLRFSAWMMAGNVVETARQRFADLWLGRNLGSTSVGVYSMASQLSLLATSEIAAPVNRAVFTRYSQAAGDITLLRNGFLRVSGLIWAIGMPAAVGIGVCASQIIAVLLGNQWGEAEVVLQILACAGVIGVMAANTQYVYWALGRSRFVTLLSAVALLVFATLASVLGSEHGIRGVATAQVAASAVALFINYGALIKAIDLPLSDVFRRIYRIPIAAALMGILVSELAQIAVARWDFGPLLVLVICVPAGVGIYGLTLWTLWAATGRAEGPEKEAIEILARGSARIRAHYQKH